MKILVDEMPKRPEECLFVTGVNFEPVQRFVCKLDKPCFLEFEGNCPYLKKYKPAEDDCK